MMKYNMENLFFNVTCYNYNIKHTNTHIYCIYAIFDSDLLNSAYQQI